jgi:hypothetical protein
MFDHLRCELPMPDGRDVRKDSFQTKSLWCALSFFTITGAGRLIFHPPRGTLEMEPDSPKPITDVDMHYHGDIEIHGEAADGTHVRYAIRFTHGSVEWIRPYAELPTIHQDWLTDRGL